MKMGDWDSSSDAGIICLMSKVPSQILQGSFKRRIIHDHVLRTGKGSIIIASSFIGPVESVESYNDKI